MITTTCYDDKYPSLFRFQKGVVVPSKPKGMEVNKTPSLTLEYLEFKRRVSFVITCYLIYEISNEKLSYWLIDGDNIYRIIRWG